MMIHTQTKSHYHKSDTQVMWTLLLKSLSWNVNLIHKQIIKSIFLPFHPALIKIQWWGSGSGFAREMANRRASGDRQAGRRRESGSRSETKCLPQVLLAYFSAPRKIKWIDLMVLASRMRHVEKWRLLHLFILGQKVCLHMAVLMRYEGGLFIIYGRNMVLWIIAGVQWVRLSLRLTY